MKALVKEWITSLQYVESLLMKKNIDKKLSKKYLNSVKSLLENHPSILKDQKEASIVYEI